METTRIKMNMDGTFRAKVLQYKSDGNTLTEKWHNLAKIKEGVYFSHSDIDNYVNIVLSRHGVFWKAGSEPAIYFDPGCPTYARNMETLGKMLAEYETRILHAAEKCQYVRLIEIEVMRRLGYDITPLIASRNAYLKKLDEEEKRKHEGEQRRERERKEAEERRKADLLADGKEKLLSHKSVTVEQIELIAEAVGYKINIRTIGFMREKVTEVVLREDGIVSVWGRKLTSRNIDGTEKVMHELYDRLKAQADEEAGTPATPTETPRISTKTADTVNVSDEGEKAAQRAENAPKRKIQYFHYTTEQLKRYIIDVYEKRTNGEWVLLPYEQIDTDAGLWDVVDGKIGWWTNWRREKFSEMNMDFNSPTCGRCCKINRTYQTENYVVSNEKLLEFTINGGYHYINKQTYNSADGRKEFYTIIDNYDDCGVNDTSDTLEGIIQRFYKYYKERATIIWQSPEFAPQSPETPQVIECVTDAQKPRETARKRQNRTTGSAQATRRDTLRNTLRSAMYVPRECSTAETDYW